MVLIIQWEERSDETLQRKRGILRNTPLYQQAYDMLADLILEGQFKPEEKLTDSGLANLLNISRTPVREAVRQLVHDGLLVGLPNRSVTIFTPTLKDLAEIYSVRSSLEGFAARLAFLNPNKKKYLEKMEECLHLSRTAVRDGDRVKMTKLNTSFHGLIIEASNNRHLHSLSQTIHNKMMMCRLHSLKRQSNMDIALDEHYEIIYNIASTDEDKCEKTMRIHIYQAGLRIIEQSVEEIDHSDPVFIMYKKQLERYSV